MKPKRKTNAAARSEYRKVAGVKTNSGVKEPTGRANQSMRREIAAAHRRFFERRGMHVPR